MHLYCCGRHVRVMGSQSTSWLGLLLLWFMAEKAQEQTPQPLLCTELQPSLPQCSTHTAGHPESIRCSEWPMSLSDMQFNLIQSLNKSKLFSYIYCTGLSNKYNITHYLPLEDFLVSCPIYLEAVLRCERIRF